MDTKDNILHFEYLTEADLNTKYADTERYKHTEVPAN